MGVIVRSRNKEWAPLSSYFGTLAAAVVYGLSVASASKKAFALRMHDGRYEKDANPSADGRCALPAWVEEFAALFPGEHQDTLHDHNVQCSDNQKETTK
jgi:hypothetical protein